ncbi:MAG: NUDIX hydrolase [Patescibacteria group bacterium]
MDNSLRRYKEFLNFIKKYKNKFSLGGNYKKGELEVITDINLFSKAEKLGTERILKAGATKDVTEAEEWAKIKVTSNSWGVWITEPVKFPPDGDLGTFSYFIHWGMLERGLCGAVVIPKISNGKFVFIKIYRVPTKTWSLEFPRGKSEPKTSVAKLIKDEIKEETGANIGEPKLVGYIRPDDGIMSEKAANYLVEIEGQKKDHRSEEAYEAIKGLVFLEKKDIEKAIIQGFYLVDGVKFEFLDAFTISAFSQAEKKGLI